jgi:hypothetical protein
MCTEEHPNVQKKETKSGKKYLPYGLSIYYVIPLRGGGWVFEKMTLNDTGGRGGQSKDDR